MTKNRALKKLISMLIMYFNRYVNGFLLDKKSYVNILIYDTSYKTPYGKKPFHVVFNKAEGYIRKNNSTKYLAFVHSDEKYERMFDRIRYFTMLKGIISDVYFVYRNIQ